MFALQAGSPADAGMTTRAGAAAGGIVAGAAPPAGTPPAGRPLKVASLFSGCGGLDLGLIILQCEIDPCAQAVLRVRFPGVRLTKDVAELERLPPDTELVSASFPCVDVSRAGGRAGIDGAATGLVRHVFRLLGDPTGPRVPWVLLENVPGLLDRAGADPPAVAFVVAELERLGYSWAQRVLSSAAFGVPQRRRRVFIVASRHGDPRDVLLAQNYACLGGCAAAFGAPCAECALSRGAPLDAITAVPAAAPPGEQQRDADAAAEEEEPLVPDDTAAAAAADALLLCDPAAAAADDLQASLGVAVDLSNAQNAPCVGMIPTMTTGNCRMAVLLPCGSFGLIRIQDAERLQGLPPDWTEPAAVLGSRGSSASREGAERRFDVALRWGLVGNAVCVPVARWLGERLRAPYAAKYVPRASARPFGAAVPDTWPRAAWSVAGVPGGRHRAEATDAPLFVPFAPVGDFLRCVGPPPSAEAVAVWAGRMRAAGWTVSGPLRRALDALLAAAPRAAMLAAAAYGGDGAGSTLPPPAPPPPPDEEALQRSVYLREPAARRMVWAKYAAFPWWPGLVADLEADHVPERSLKAPGRAADALLVVFFGDGTWQWVKPECVQDFAPHFGAHAGAPVGRARSLFLAAVAEAKEMWDSRAAGAAADASAPPAPGAAAPLPAMPQGAAAELARRCGACRACKTTSHRACLLADARRLAAAGHVGASLTAAGAAARGARVEIFWPMDERYYCGTLLGFDPYSCHHRVLYDDDEWETVALWKETVAAQGVAPPPPGSKAARGDLGDEDEAAGLSSETGNWEHGRGRGGGAATVAASAAAAAAAAAAQLATPAREAAAPPHVASPAQATPTAALPPARPQRAAAASSKAAAASVLPAPRLLPPPPLLPAAAAPPPPARAPSPPAKRRRACAASVDYAALLASPVDRPHSARCAACKTQKKGVCGTPTASRLCLNRTPDMPLRREANRRGGGGGGGGGSGSAAARLLDPFRFQSIPTTLPVLPASALHAAAAAPAGRAGRAGAAARHASQEGPDEPTRVLWSAIPGYVPPAHEA